MFDLSALWQYFETAQGNVVKDRTIGYVGWVVTLGPRPGDLWIIGKDNLATLTPPAPTCRSQHVFRQCSLYAEFISHLN